MPIAQASGTALDGAEWRMLTPSNAINYNGANSPQWLGSEAKLIHISGFLDYLHPVVQDQLMTKDLIIVQRNLVHEQVFDAIQYYQGMGKPVAVDLDDAYPILPWSNPAHRFWIENPEHLDPPPLAMLERGLQIAGHLIAPNRILLNSWSHVAKGHYLQNFARSEWWTDLPTRASTKAQWQVPEDSILIGWGGSVSHYDSWWGSGLRDAATRICRRHPNAYFVVCGNDPRLHTQLPVPNSQKIAQPGVDPSLWPRIVKGFDIGVAPLFGPYDQHRSWIKGLEYLLAGVPWVATAGEPYRDIAQLGTLIQNSADAWEDALEFKIRNLKREQEESQDKIEYASRWLAINQMDAFSATYGEIIHDPNQAAGRLPGISVT